MNDLVKISSILGLPVIYDNGEASAGILKDVIINTEEKLIKIFVIEKKGITKSFKRYKLEDVYDIGGGAIIIKEEAFKNFNLSIEEKNSKSNKQYKKYTDINKGKDEIRIFSKKGEDLGTVKDIYFSLDTGKIEAFELSDGLFQDIIEGRKIIPLIGRYEFGEENIIVDNDAVQEMTNSGGGLKKIF